MVSSEDLVTQWEVEGAGAKGLSRRDRKKLNMERATERRAWHRNSMGLIGEETWG